MTGNLLISQGQYNHKLTCFSLLRLHFQLPSICLYNIITQTQPQARALSRRFGSKEGLEDLVFYSKNTWQSYVEIYQLFVTSPLELV